MSMVFIIILLSGCSNNSRPNIYDENGISMVSRTKGKDFQIYRNGDFHSEFLVGVNMGAALPGAFPGEMAIPKDMYLDWFQMIHEMNANVIRVYTTQMPHFYQAFYEFNQSVEDPLYIMHGVWLNENDIKTINDPYAGDEYMLNNFIQDGQDLVDVIHGNAFLEEKPGFSSGTYTYDVSEYVIGWILGIEWDPEFALNTITENQDIEPYLGQYLTSNEDANPFESFLAEVGDKIIAYEVDNYQFMRPLSFVNWPTTDHLSHPNEPDEKEDMVSINMNHIEETDDFISGFFASFHVYPYYPEFLNFSIQYRDFVDHRGEENLYQGYLTDLVDTLDMPVLIAEFGVPASRGKTHQDFNRGFNQGFLSEEEQGLMNVEMLEDIYHSGSVGALLFTWQDEWFKRTWNTMDLDEASRRPNWSNVQTNEQHFGLLAFEPGENQSIRYVDGDIEDWSNSEAILSNDTLDLHTAFDERYMYIMVESKSIDFEEERLLIPIITNPNQGNDHIESSDISFNQDVDFYIDIRGKDYGEIFVDAYYDPFYFLYHEKLEMLDKIPSYRQKNSGIFNPIYQALSAELYLPEDDMIVPFQKHRTGPLTYGNGNPSHEDYHSLSDYFIKDNVLEIRIPWQLLNISDPSGKLRLADFYEHDWFVSESIENIKLSAAFTGENQDPDFLFAQTSWDAWEEPTYHMRLKASYDYIQSAFQIYRNDNN
jgi:hypothetical protein